LVYIAVGTYNNDHPEHMGDAYEISTTDRTMTGEVPSPDSGTIAYLPTVIAPTTAPTLMIVGDSIDYGVTDVLDVFGDLGIICRSVGSKFGYFNVSQPGETASGFVSTHTQRLLGLPFCTHVFAGHGTNDIFAGDSKATIEGNLTTVYGLFSTKTVFGRTIVPRTTGPWTTTAAQAVLAGESVRTTLNTDLLSTFHPGGGVFNVGAVNEVTGGKWSAPPATTDDGIHPNQLGYANIASSGAINTALIGTPAAPASDTGSAWGDHGTLITVSTSRRTNDTAYPTDVGNPNTTVRGATGNSSGLKYFELEMLGGGASGNPRSQILGLMTITTANGAPLDDYIGNINDSFGITDGAAYFFVSGTIFSAVNTSAVSFFAGDFFGWNLDFTNKFGYMHRNGVYLTGSGGVPGNPNSGATGTGHVVSWTGTPTLYPAATLYGATNLPPRPVRIRTVQFLRALTGSYTAWG
jgi:hypothetical protein